MPLFSREKSSLKGRWRLETVQGMRYSSSNPVSCSETSIKIYGSKEEIRARKSPETVDAPGFAPDASIPVTLYGGAEGSRTPVRKHFDRTFSGRRTVSAFPPCTGTGQTAQFSRVMMHGRGNSYPPHVRHINDALPGLWPLRFRRLPLVRQRQQYDCCQLILSCPFLGGQAPPPAYPASTPPSKPVQPRMRWKAPGPEAGPDAVSKLIYGRDPAASPAPDM